MQQQSSEAVAQKCHNVDPLAKMIASKHQKLQTTSNDLRTIDKPTNKTRFLQLLTNWLRFVLTSLITLGAQMSPTTLKLLLTAMTVVSVSAAEEGKSLKKLSSFFTSTAQ